MNSKPLYVSAPISVPPPGCIFYPPPGLSARSLSSPSSTCSSLPPPDPTHELPKNFVSTQLRDQLHEKMSKTVETIVRLALVDQVLLQREAPEHFYKFGTSYVVELTESDRLRLIEHIPQYVHLVQCRLGFACDQPMCSVWTHYISCGQCAACRRAFHRVCSIGLAPHQLGDIYGAGHAGMMFVFRECLTYARPCGTLHVELHVYEDSAEEEPNSKSPICHNGTTYYDVPDPLPSTGEEKIYAPDEKGFELAGLENL